MGSVYDVMNSANIQQNIDLSKLTDPKVSDKFKKFAEDKNIKLTLPSGKLIGSTADGAKTVDLNQLIKILYGADDKSEMSHKSLGLSVEDVKDLKTLFEQTGVVTKKSGIGTVVGTLTSKLSSSPSFEDVEPVILSQLKTQLIIQTYNEFNDLIIAMMQSMREIDEESAKEQEAQELMAKAQAQMEDALSLLRQGESFNDEGKTPVDLYSSANMLLEAARALLA